MPELPEVEFARRALVRWTEGRIVVGSEVLDARSVRSSRTDRPSAGRADGAAALSEVARGRPGPLRRHGKRLLWEFERGALLLHLGMTGKWTRIPPAFPKARLDLDDGRALWFSDPRLLGGIVPTTREVGERLLVEGLGPDALAGPLPRLRGKRPVKVALMDQSVVAGIGNVQAMEALWRAGLDPATPCDALDDATFARLDAAVREQLLATIAMLEGDDEIVYVEEDRDANLFSIYRRARCPRCAGDISKIVQGGRSTYWCATCQPPQTPPG
ncbi:MAG: Fpg/Nei family DNA glycosylase [Myxococcota bacterium]